MLQKMPVMRVNSHHTCQVNQHTEGSDAVLIGQQVHQLPAVWTSVRAKPVMLAAHVRKLQPAHSM